MKRLALLIPLVFPSCMTFDRTVDISNEYEATQTYGKVFVTKEELLIYKWGKRDREMYVNEAKFHESGQFPKVQIARLPVGSFLRVDRVTWEGNWHAQTPYCYITVIGSENKAAEGLHAKMFLVGTKIGETLTLPSDVVVEVN